MAAWADTGACDIGRGCPVLIVGMENGNEIVTPLLCLNLELQQIHSTLGRMWLHAQLCCAPAA